HRWPRRPVRAAVWQEGHGHQQVSPAALPWRANQRATPSAHHDRVEFSVDAAETQPECVAGADASAPYPGAGAGARGPRVGGITVFDRLAELASEHAELERALADPGVHADQDQARDFGRRYAELTPIVNAYTEWQQTEADEATARELAPQDPSFAAEADQLKKRKTELGQQLRRLLVPRDPND